MNVCKDIYLHTHNNVVKCVLLNAIYNCVVVVAARNKCNRIESIVYTSINFPNKYKVLKEHNTIQYNLYDFYLKMSLCQSVIGQIQLILPLFTMTVISHQPASQSLVLCACCCVVWWNKEMHLCV